LGEARKHKTNKEGFYRKHQNRIPKRTWTSPNLESTSPCQKPSSKASYKKEEENNTKPKGTLKNLRKGNSRGQGRKRPSYALARLDN
jgi:hypothetical protein